MNERNKHCGSTLDDFLKEEGIYESAKAEAIRRSRTDLGKIDAMTDAELERVLAEDEEERDLEPDWTRAKLVFTEPKRSVHLRLEQEIIDFFKAQGKGKGHISRMQAVL
jgi:uncharacterized protein (DUF4415 family)